MILVDRLDLRGKKQRSHPLGDRIFRNQVVAIDCQLIGQTIQLDFIRSTFLIVKVTYNEQKRFFVEMPIENIVMPMVII
jgi:hypothetical protein